MYFDVVVVGAGHAGCEAAAAAARIGANTCLITFNKENIGELSCNPSIGGVGKGIIVKEIDALDGLMPKVIDRAGIHYKTLNRSRGPAVWGPRAQADRKLYKQSMQELLAQQENLTIIFGEVVDLIIDENYEEVAIQGIKYIPEGEKSLEEIIAGATVITAGTFLDGLIHIGNETTKAGRFSEKASIELANKLRRVGMNVSRLKTGTPPRLRRSSIDFSNLEAQPGDEFPIFFSYDSGEYQAAQISCYITHTNAETHKVIRDNIYLSPMYSGQISSSGPRYCPSIEDKITRFADKERHQLFLEPEGIDSDVIYPNGISTSLPKATQDEIIRSIKGLEDVEILRYGYAIEYDYFNPKQLKSTLESKVIKRLFLAGQINGTTGYEEAAGQGLIAGINAALTGSEGEFSLTRGDAYIGVMIDDLINKGVTEPYRMMTSRAEFRLSLRYDNAFDRLTEKGSDIGVLSQKIKDYYNDTQSIKDLIIQIKTLPVDNILDLAIEVASSQNRQYKTLDQALGQVGIDFNPLKLMDIFGFTRAEVIKLQKEHADRLYEHYIKIQQKDIKTLNDDKMNIIPDNLDYNKISSLSNEIRTKIAKFKPQTILELKNIEGMTPAAVIAIQIYLAKNK
jgi:tRNA uridine 5-carboxymethylaminomethyl modification enzyme